ncbi:MAG: nuclear transport factor 2 family protein [Bacteroidota bacterium]
MKATQITLLITLLNISIMNAQEIINFKVIGGYQFAEGYSLHNNDPFLFAQAGQLTGSWHWEFDNGQKGNTHVNGATANRVLGSGENELFGTMQINMYEFEGTPMGQDILYLAYTSKEFKIEGSKVSIVVTGEFIGGKGKYEGASGHLKVTSVNGFFEDGLGTIILKADKIEVTEEDVRGWVDNYFKATQSGDAKVWANSFANNVYLNDPYGSDIPQSREEVVAIGEGFMSSFETAGLYPDFVYVDGLTATVKWTGRGITKDGQEATFEGINVTTYDKRGKIVSHIGYWDPEKMVIK